MPDLQARLQELNQMAGDGEGKLVAGKQGAHVLHMPEPVRLQVFQDGLQVWMDAWVASWQTESKLCRFCA
jgi:hypothetical protein